MSLHVARRFRTSARRSLAGVAGLSIASALALSGTEALAQGCAMCGTAVSSPEDPLARGLAYSIALMLAVPNLLIASIGGWLFYVYRRAAQQSSGAAPGLPARPTEWSSDRVLRQAAPDGSEAPNDRTRRPSRTGDGT